MTPATKTPFQLRGYKPTDLFRVVGKNANGTYHGIAPGSLVRLVDDDGSVWPQFALVLGAGTPVTYITLDALEVVRE